MSSLVKLGMGIHLLRCFGPLRESPLHLSYYEQSIMKSYVRAGKLRFALLIKMTSVPAVIPVTTLVAHLLHEIRLFHQRHTFIFHKY